MIELTFNCFFAIQSVLSINRKPPIRDSLVLTNQSSSGILIYFTCDVLTAKESNIRIGIRISACITFFKIQFYKSYAKYMLFLITLMTAIYLAVGKEKKTFVAVCSPLPLLLLFFFIFACVERSWKY